MTLTAGQVLQNRYRVVSLLGQGGMGAVYRAWDLRLNVPVALKEMTAQPGLDAVKLNQLRWQFQQEAVVLARLSHPHLVRVSDFFEEGGNAYLVMDFVEGESLDKRIEREGALPERVALLWARQLLDGLAYCHSQGIIHRDVKPQNVIIRPDGRAVLVDFGLFKLWDPYNPHTQTAIRWLGTPEYAPPEQYGAETGHTDPRSDLYSLGAALYHALTGQAPPTATQRIVDPSALKPPRVLAHGLGLKVERAVLRAMELSPGARFQSAAEMRSALLAAPSRRRVPGWAWAVAGAAALVVLSGCVSLLAGAARVGPLASLFWPPGPTPSLTVSPTVVVVSASTSTPYPTSTATATPTRRPTVTPVPAISFTATWSLTPTESPTRELTATPTRTPTRTSTARPVPVTATATPQPTSPSNPPPPGLVLDFEREMTWRRGDEPYGTLVRSAGQVRSGQYAGQLAYDFPAVTVNYVVFIASPSVSLSGQPTGLSAWVYGDGSGHYLNTWVEDSAGEVRQYTFGRVTHRGWQAMSAWFDERRGWPNGHISGSDNGALDYPVRFYALVLDGVPDGQASSGAIYLDDVSVLYGASPPAPTQEPTRPPTGGALLAAPPVLSQIMGVGGILGLGVFVGLVLVTGWPGAKKASWSPLWNRAFRRTKTG